MVRERPLVLQLTKQIFAQLGCRCFHDRHENAIAKIKLGASTATRALIAVGATGKLGPPNLIKTETPAERIKTLRRKFD